MQSARHSGCRSLHAQALHSLFESCGQHSDAVFGTRSQSTNLSISGRVCALMALLIGTVTAGGSPRCPPIAGNPMSKLSTWKSAATLNYESFLKL
jgi:hypothetical protein